MALTEAIKNLVMTVSHRLLSTNVTAIKLLDFSAPLIVKARGTQGGPCTTRWPGEGPG